MMLRKLIGRVLKPQTRFWVEDEIRELITHRRWEDALAACQALHPQTKNRDLLLLCLQGEIAFRQHDDEAAERFYHDALKLAPGHAEAHYGLSLLLHARNAHEGAFKHSLFAISIFPDEPRYLSQLGLCHLCLGNYPQAEENLRRALLHCPDDKSTWNNLGITLLTKGRPTEARHCFKQALQLDPSFLQAQQNLQQLDLEDYPELASADSDATATAHSTMPGANIKDVLILDDVELMSSEPWHEAWTSVSKLAEAGETQKAFDSLERLLARFPDSERLAVRSELLYRNLGEAESGIEVLRAMLTRQPNSAIVHQGLAEALSHRTDYVGAETHFKRALELGLRNIDTLQGLAKALIKQDKYAESLPLRREVQERWPSEVALANLAISRFYTCEYITALNDLDELNANGLIPRLGLESVYVQALLYGGRIEEALGLVNFYTSSQGNSPHTQVLLAATQLLTLDFEHGWDGYRYRQANLEHYRVLPAPEWQGESLEGKVIVVLAEQGLGDQVMFSSCLPDLLQLKPKRVVVEAIVRVAPTIARSFPECEVVATKQDKGMEWLRNVETVDYYIALGDLPRWFRRSLASFPRHAYLVPDSDRVRYWRQRLESLGPGPYLGTSWRGGTELTRTAIRTLSPELLAPLVNAVPSQWVCLQYGDVQHDLSKAAQSGVELAYWPEAISNLDEFAALTLALDGVFTVCNTTVHYAGAVGQQVWVLAPKVPEWRYGLTNSYMPWYPSVEVLRQNTPNDWSSVIEMARLRIIDKFSHRPPT